MPSITASSTSGTRNAAQLLTLSATGDSIASGGDYVVFDATVVQLGFVGTDPMPSDSWVHPVDGIYILVYEHAWSSFTSGGTIRLEVGGVLLPEGVLADGSTGQYGHGEVLYFARAGTVGRIKVTQTSGSGQVCDAVAHVAISDPSLTSVEYGGDAVSLGAQSSPSAPGWSGNPADWVDSTAHWIWHAALSSGSRPIPSITR